MDQSKTGALIRKLRLEHGMTQKTLAEAIGVSDKAVSKWERGFGSPDVSLLNALSSAFGINVENLLTGSLHANEIDGGNMKRIRFYVCPTCGNILTSTGVSDISCCGRKLTTLAAAPADGEHMPEVAFTDGEHYITFPHTMTKDHYLSFVALVHYDRMILVRLYPEQDAALRLPKINGAKLYTYCTQHGLIQATIKG